MSEKHLSTKVNRLAKEKSPYLLQHASNPVEWFPWSEEAFTKAKKEDKPIFLSIGYSTCHWCHVMERESFEDEEVADILNKNFICIKVDREERPDIDHIYMQVCQVLTGHGGWPLSIFITPEQKPFYAGTYFSKKSMYGRIGFVELLQSIREIWKKDRGRVIDTTDSLMKVIQESRKTTSKEQLTISVIDSAVEQYQTNFDETYGGFGRAPKFPTPHHLLLLLRLYHVRKDSALLEMVEKTLEAMYKGGIYDHIGFGFSRYSTDEKWLVPHFEKMLYDNALLSIAYLEAHQVTGKALYKKAAEEIFTYVLRDMTSPEGGFFSAEDADSEGVEGKFYVWSKEEILKVLGDQGEEFCKIYGITDSGNFEGQNIPNLIDNHLQNKILSEMIQKLFLYRESRVHPHKDDKILTAWNGLMIAALSYGARVLQHEEYRQAAEKAVEFIFKRLIREDGRLLARYREGEAAYLGYAEDYAFLIWGLIELYQTTYDVQFLQKAILLEEKVIELFYDHSDGGLFLYGKDGENLITRPKEVYDGAIPSGNSIMTWNWIRLARITNNEALIQYARDTFSTFNKDIQSYPIGYSAMLIGLLLDHESSQEIVVVGENTEKKTQKMLSLIQQSYRPFTTVLLLNESQKQELTKINADLESYNKINENTTIYMCENFVCRNPTTSVEKLQQWL